MAQSIRVFARRVRWGAVLALVECALSACTSPSGGALESNPEDAAADVRGQWVRTDATEDRIEIRSDGADYVIASLRFGLAVRASLREGVLSNDTPLFAFEIRRTEGQLQLTTPRGQYRYRRANPQEL